MQEKENNVKPIRCALYTRVSTDQQAELEFSSCDAQADRVRAFIASQENFILVGSYSDPGFTGANIERPALRALLDDVQSRKIDMVITYKIDRLTRSPKDFYQLIEVFENHGVGFISVTERFDTSTPAGRLLRNIMLTFAQFERELASERVRDKIAQKVQRGLYPGGRPPLGYKIENRALVVDPVAAPVVKRMFECYIETRSLSKAFKVVAASGLRPRTDSAYGNSLAWHLLRNPVLVGKILYKGKLYPGQHPPIIDPALFEHVQGLLKNHPREKPRPYLNMPYAGLIECQECGSVMSASHVVKNGPEGKRRYYYYRCNRVVHKGWRSCSTRQINADRLHALVEGSLTRISKDPFYLKNLIVSKELEARQAGATGVELRPEGWSYSMEKLQNSLFKFNGMCARKTGIERALAVQEGIQKVLYSKESVAIDFYWERFIDGTDAPPAPAAALRAAAETKKGPNPFSGLEPSSWMWPVVSATLQRVSSLKSLRTLRFLVPNSLHNYWEAQRLPQWP